MTSRSRAAGCAATVLSVTAFAMPGSAVAVSPKDGGGRCVGAATGEMTYSAAAFGETRTFRATFRAHYECETSEATITSATETGESTGWLNCLTLTGQESGKDHFAWNDGRESTLSYVDDIRYGVSLVTGRFVSGVFKGLDARFDGVVGANIATLCGDTGAGTSPLLYAGYGRFGDALTDGARP